MEQLAQRQVLLLVGGGGVGADRRQLTVGMSAQGRVTRDVSIATAGVVCGGDGVVFPVIM